MRNSHIGEPYGVDLRSNLVIVDADVEVGIGNVSVVMVWFVIEDIVIVMANY